MKKWMAFWLMSIVVTACDSPTTETTLSESAATEAPSIAADHPLETTSATWYTYEGVIPCASCAGIKMTLSLENQADKNTREYKLTQTYLETEDGDRSFDSSGFYEVTYGTQDNPGAMIITLYDQHDTPIHYFLQDKDAKKLTLLDQNKKLIESALNYSLSIK